MPAGRGNYFDVKTPKEGIEREWMLIRDAAQLAGVSYVLQYFVCWQYQSEKSRVAGIACTRSP